MNMTMIDLGQTQARPGDPVVLIGNQGDATVTADDWADWAETINYEIVARFPSGLARTYDEG
jgi:alanine racemase